MFKEDEVQKLKFTINDSNIQGQGIFPVKNIKKGEFIGYAYQIIGEIGKLNEDTEYIIGQETLLGNIHNYCNWGIKFNEIDKYKNLPLHA